MHGPRTRAWLLEKVFGHTLRRRVSLSVLLMSFAAISAIAVLAGLSHHHMVMVKAQSEARALGAEFWSKSRIAVPHITRTVSDARDADTKLSAKSVVATFFAQGKPYNALLIGPPKFSSEPFTDRGRAYITRGAKVLWSSDPRLRAMPMDGEGLGLRTIIYEEGVEEVYLYSSTVELAAVTGLTEDGGVAESLVDLTFHVALGMEPYRREIREYRYVLASIVVVVMTVLGTAVHIVIRRQILPLERITQSIQGMKSGSGERVDPRDSDPLEIRTLAEQFNVFVNKQDEAREAEREAREAERKAREAERDAEKKRLEAEREAREAERKAREAERNAEKKALETYRRNMAEMGAELRELTSETINRAGFMHAVARILYPTRHLVDDKTIAEDIQQAHSMIEDKLNELIRKGSDRPVHPTDVVSVAKGLFTPLPAQADGRNQIQIYMEKRYTDRRFPAEFFPMRYEAEPLYVGVNEVELREMMVSLLHNAGREAKSKVRTSVSCADEMVRIVIEDDGRGFPPSGRKKLLVFGKETRGSGEKHGVGLPHVRHVACQHCGDLSLEDSKDLGGARVVLELPLVDGPADEVADESASRETTQLQLPAGK